MGSTSPASGVPKFWAFISRLALILLSWMGLAALIPSAPAGFEEFLLILDDVCVEGYIAQPVSVYRHPGLQNSAGVLASDLRANSLVWAALLEYGNL